MELESTQQTSQVRAGELTAALQAAEEQNQRLATELESMLRSHSWKLTKPLRITVGSLRASIRTSWLSLAPEKQGTEANEHRIIKKSGLFSRAFYQSAYPDIFENHIDPISHYCSYGWSEGRNPSEYFDTKFYLETHRDVHDSGMNPLTHYIRFGDNEGRAANPNGLKINGDGKVKKILRIAGIIKKNPNLLTKFIREARRNGVKHAVKKARAAVQPLSAMPTTTTKGVADLWNLFSQSPNIPHLDADMTIDIIIPVYNGQKYLQPLFSSIISNTMLPYRLLVADDKSTDADILPLLYAIKSKNPDVDITIVENSENLGFVKTVNKLAQLANGNFVLLNTDVEVPPHWLERLIYPLVTMDGVASATPFTNSGTICSFPNYLQDNDLPSGMDVRSVDRAFSFVKFSNNILDIPTGVGFCMAINKAVWDKIGGFDEVFGKGYGEENDWCMRAGKFGYRNLHVPNLFVYHKHGGSFLTEDKERYQRNNLAIINERHPDYSGKVQQLIENDAFSFLRKCVLAKALCEKHGAIAIFDHDLGGGANQYVAESLSNHKVSIIIRYNTIRCEFEASFRGDNISDLIIKIDTLPDIKDLVRFFNVDELVINNLVSYPKVIDFIDFIRELTDRRIHLTYMMHDFYAICPMYNLINYEMEYCGVPKDPDYCNRCLKSNPLIRVQVAYIRSEYPNISISDWRTHFGRLLDLADKIVFFSQSSVAIASKAYPELSLRPDNLEVKPHKVTWVRRVATVAPGDVINIGIIGVMTFNKGIHIISALAGYIDSCQLNYRVHVFGEVADLQIGLEQYSCVTPHGRYERDELPRLMEQAHIDIILIPSIWPETFSYTTEESILMNLPVAVFDIGAPGERVQRYAKGIILRDKSPRTILKSIDEYFDRSPIVQRDTEQEQEDEIVFVCVSNNEYMYQRCVGTSSFMTHNRIIKYNNSEYNVPIPTRYNSAISELLGAGYQGWIFFIHNDFSIMEDASQIVKHLKKDAIYGPIGAIIENGKKNIYGEILQGHEGSLINHGKKIDLPTPVDTVDCQSIFFHSDVVRKYPLRFDEAAPLDFHQYAEEFCLAAKTLTGLQTYAVQIKCKHLSWGRIDESFDRAIKYINNKYRTIRWAGTCTHLDKV
ncbi:MAG: glycosyltransferase [Acidithiobacillus sp.]